MANKDTLTGEDEDLATEQQEAKDEKLVIVDKPPADSKDDQDDDDDVEDDRRVKRDEGDHGDEDREKVRERRRLEKQERKERRQEAINRNRVEMEFLRRRNDELEQRLSHVEQTSTQQQASSIDTEIATMKRQLQMAETVFAEATKKQNGEDAATALRYRDEARDRLKELETRKQEFSHEKQVQRQPQVDPRVVAHARKFASENKWYDINGRDEDSAIMQAIDRTIVAEGYDPTTPEYWQELRERGKKRLPDRFKNTSKATQLDDGDEDDDEPQLRRKPKGGPALGSGRDGAASPNTRREVYISPERKQALIEAGVWDDPKLRDKYVRKYMEYDRQAKERGR